MFTILSALLFSLSANLDTAILGISYGVKNIHICFNKVLLISTITSFITFVSMIFGNYINGFLSYRLTNSIGSICLIAIGLFILIKDFLQKKNVDKNCNNSNNIKNCDSSKSIELKEVFLISLALSFNNIAIGIVASLSGLNAFFTTVFTFVFSFLFIYLGNILANGIFKDKLSKFISPISSLILILLGILELFF